MQESSKKGDKNDIKNTSHSINKKSRRQNVYDLENTLWEDYKIDFFAFLGVVFVPLRKILNFQG